MMHTSRRNSKLFLHQVKMRPRMHEYLKSNNGPIRLPDNRAVSFVHSWSILLSASRSRRKLYRRSGVEAAVVRAGRHALFPCLAGGGRQRPFINMEQAALGLAQPYPPAVQLRAQKLNLDSIGIRYSRLADARAARVLLDPIHPGFERIKPLLDLIDAT